MAQATTVRTSGAIIARPDQADTMTIFVTSGGAFTRDGGPAVPKPRLTHNVVPFSS